MRDQYTGAAAGSETPASRCGLRHLAEGAGESKSEAVIRWGPGLELSQVRGSVGGQVGGSQEGAPRGR